MLPQQICRSVFPLKRTAILADDTKSLAAADVEGHVAERPVVLVKAAAMEGCKFFKAVPRRVVDGITLRHARKFNSRC